MIKVYAVSFRTIVRVFLQSVAVLTLLVATGWLMVEPGFEPLLAILGSVAVLLSPLFLNLEEKAQDKPLPFTDECDFVPEIQLDAFDVGNAEIGGGGVANFLHDYQVYFGGRHNEMAELDAWLIQTDKPFGLLVAPAGMGKSALVANWSKRLQDSGQAVVVYYPISLRYGTNSQKQTLRSLLMQMSDVARKEAALEPERSYMRGLDLIDESFSNEELRELCLHLSVDYDNLGEGGKRDKAQELIRLCQRKGRLDELVPLCREMRTHHDWDAAFSRSTPDRLLYEPPQEGDDELLWISQLRENLRRSTGWDKPLVVVIDGFDELANQLNQPDIQEVDFLPNETGAGIYILAVARGESVDIRDKWLRKLKWNRSPVELFELGALEKEDIGEMVSRSKLATEDDKLILLADKIYDLSEGGDPLISSLWVDRLASLVDKRIESLLELLEKGDPGINGYIDGVFAQLEPIRSSAAKPLFELLSLARGPLATGDINALGIKIDSDQLKLLVSLSGRLIIQNAQLAYVFSHSRIRQAVQDEFVSPERCQYWLEQFHRYGRCSLKHASQLPAAQIPEYILNYYADHLYLDKPAGYETSLYALVSEVWMKAHYEYFWNYDGFLIDVDRALSISRQVSMEQAKHGQAITQIALQVKGLMCHTSITSLSGNLSPHLPALLVRDEIWEPQQALSHVQRIPDLAQRTKALVALLTVKESKQILSSPKNQNLHDVIISSSLRNMQFLWQQNQVDEAELYRLQLAISPFLSTDHLDEALLLAGKVQRSIWQARLLAELLPLMKDEDQHIQTIKQLIHACSKIDDSPCSKDIPFIIPTFTSIAQNLSMERLATAFAEVWKEASHVISETEKRDRKKRIFDYLAWHIEKHQAIAFVELLFEYDSLPQVAEKIGRFACRLDDEIVYDIAVHLEKEFALAPQQKRQSYGMGAMAEGVGMAFITLALSRKGEHQQKILKIASNYIQTYGVEDSPFEEQDLQLFYQMAAGQITDAKAADLVKQGKFMQRFWQNRGDSHELSMYSQEIVAYLGIETLEVLFERCIESKSTTEYWHVTTSPYILPAIAKKLSDEELSLIYEIGHSRGQSCGHYGYVRSATENIKRMPEAVRLDTIHWALWEWASDIYLREAVARFITPDVLLILNLRTKIGAPMAKHLPPETVQYIVNNFDLSYYGKVKGTEVLLQFIQYLPEIERKILLQNMKAELFQIKDYGELNELIQSLVGNVPNRTRFRIRSLTRPAKTARKDAHLLTSIEEDTRLLDTLFLKPFLIEYGQGFSDYVGKVLFALAPNSLVKTAKKQIRLIRLGKRSHQAVQQQQSHIEKIATDPEYSIELNSWFEKAHYWMIKHLASSRSIWVLYLLCALTFTMAILPISIVVSLLMMPFLMVVIGGSILLEVFKFGIEWLIKHFGRDQDDSARNGNKGDKTHIWKSMQRQVQELNDLPDSQARRKVFMQIGACVVCVGKFPVALT